MDYRPLTVKKHPEASKHNPASNFYRQYKSSVFIKEYAPVTSVHFSPSKPHRYAVTAATRVQIYAPRTQKVAKTISRFKDVARSGHIRQDGKLVVAGDDSGLVQVFDINSRAILRTLDAHKQPVHVAKFSSLDSTQVLTCSDDTTVRIWDIPSQSTITTFTAHSDYVRSGQVSPTNPHLVLTGSYDSTVRLFDSRTGKCEIVMGQESGSGPNSSPVEQVLAYPSGSAVLSSSGPILRVWDLVAGGRCIRALSNHQKTVTSLAFDAKASRLLTAGLDQMVKVYDVSNYHVVHTMRYPAPILCLALSPDETHIAAGMSDGTLSVRRRQLKPSQASADAAMTDTLKSGAFETFLGSGTIGQGRSTKSKQKSTVTGEVAEFKVEARRKKRLKQFDKLMKGFKYSAALDSVLRKKIPPTTTFSLIQELIHRDGLRSALAGRDDVLLEPIIRLLLKHATDPRFSALVCDVTSVVLDMYNAVLGQSPIIDALFIRLRRKVQAELRLQKELVKVQGSLDMLFASVTLANV